MNLAEIEKWIDILENEEMTFTGCQKLASLYICQEHAKAGLKTMIDGSNEGIRKELCDIFPQYERYIEVKRDFQMHKTGKEELIRVLTYLCKELEEFVDALYTSSQTQEEQGVLDNLIKNLKNLSKNG